MSNIGNRSAEDYLIERLGGLTPWQKLRMVSEINNSCRSMAMIGLKQRYPGAGEEELRFRLAALWLDRNIMIKVFSWDPREKGL